ncbi:MAG: hypothetical protein WA066_02920 [Candidatus Omnitrophota bacterium]
MIFKKYGQVIVTSENIRIDYFEVDMEVLLGMEKKSITVFQRRVMRWAINRLKEEIAKLEPEIEDLSKYIGQIGDNGEDYAP